MQVEIKDIRGGKCRGGKGTNKQLVDSAISFDTDYGRRGRGGMGGHYQAHLGSSRRQRDGGAIVERSGHAAFWMRGVLVWIT